ncbi:sulfurtransferase [Thermosynechococcaceae cyanobacterium BACA0444]|uniref:Sulfurtransferase n=1 Tax=Pseudocalidococcus azoricus BACA0444 TaxID=2918990 RepID=A0AAE4FT50_9CYAN|nr:sulfurtransferase [Pseudocalidococcus azoricus]MDS3861676.1 sulfurtransferase [Pseudocalidococcus azoricus BACA0444]
MTLTTTAVVSRQWLGALLGQPGLVVIDCRFSLSDPGLGEQQYQQGHIPGAFYLHLNRDLSGPVETHGGRHPLPDPITLGQTLAKCGIDADTWVVAYDDSRACFAARLWWLLRWLGHDQVAVLDGGYQAYCQAQLPISKEIPSPQTGNFQPRPRLDWVVDYQFVKDYQPDLNRVLIDSREPARYQGEIEPIDPIAGHIPGAVNYPWTEITDLQGFVKSVPELQAHWQQLDDAAGLVVYCGSGVTACVNLLGLELAGRPGAKLYAGSWSDWCSYQI